MGCEQILPPHRDGSPLDAPLELAQLPSSREWEGQIAYLDRDGVLNVGSEEYVNAPGEVVLLPSADTALGRLRRAGFRICVVTNQSPIGRGHWGHENLADIHQRLRSILQSGDDDAVLDLILYSPYAPWDGSWARKPNPGMLEAGRQLLDSANSNPGSEVGILYGSEWLNRPDESTSVLVGDRNADMGAAASHGVRGIRCDSSLGLASVVEIILGDGNE
ncbi:MAG: HAD-IIIA family hydrolase [Candidatus Thermoplasmatota archaeon]|nr:HAD-IIIA family hydrolase [Candidatus Thermoplasmatota archaeon]